MLVNSPASAARSVPPCLGVVAADTLVPTMVAPVTGVGALGGGLAGATGAQAATSAAAAPSGDATQQLSPPHHGWLLAYACWSSLRTWVACRILPIFEQAVEVTHWSPPSDDVGQVVRTTSGL